MLMALMEIGILKRIDLGTQTRERDGFKFRC
jgi:hypothetical protein